MNVLSRIAAAALVCLAGTLAQAQSAPASDNEGLVLVKSKMLDKAWLLPGADFRPYRKVLLKEAEVAFQKNWLRDMNSNRASLSAKVTDADAAKIVQEARTGFNQIWAETFKSNGWEVVTAPGEDVLQVRPAVINLYVNAPAAATSGAVAHLHGGGGRGHAAPGGPGLAHRHAARPLRRSPANDRGAAGAADRTR